MLDASPVPEVQRNLPNFPVLAKPLLAPRLRSFPRNQAGMYFEVADSFPCIDSPHLRFISVALAQISLPRKAAASIYDELLVRVPGTTEKP
jgi:hypothetical protein